ncbi:MAG: riboflavin synthase [Tistlia sp.]|uniref:riboflavin synthase n=1 Tax=Tistlia sp. TaxID=3057121 RepID=UPI0034A0F83F
MFTGIVTDRGRVRALDQRGDLRIEIDTAYDTATLELGASVACNGCCLTVVAKGEAGEGRGWFAVDASAETRSKTAIGDWRVGTAVNLERSLRLGDELGGHLVSGHVDGLAEVVEIRPEGDSMRYRFAAPAALGRFLAPKGSVALDGVSLTVNEVEAPGGEGPEARMIFGCNVIPHTAEVTTFGSYGPGQRVNLEIDLIARYVARLVPAPLREA